MPRTPDEKNGSAVPASGVGPKKPGSFSKLFAEVAKVASREVGRAWLFLPCFWGPWWSGRFPVLFFGFSDTWQLVINTGTTIVTFLMVFLIKSGDGARRCGSKYRTSGRGE